MGTARRYRPSELGLTPPLPDYFQRFFDALPQETRGYVYRRIRESLTGTDHAAVLDILSETKAEFRQP